MPRMKYNPSSLFARVTITLLLVSIVSALLFSWSEALKKALLVFWIVVPPLWLWFEFCYLYERGITPFPNDFEKYKYSQELSKNLWIAISAILLFIYFGKLPGLN
ncbi:MAG: hypothetical protein SFW36_07710 [Leptolyngbyaceae cyanobacterium bins.59]|nr:hypothetical protein [Leptolyngbyaceae cyanobacterium bins.59]